MPVNVNNIIGFARRQLGTPYHWGGESRATGFDCSGLVYAAYRAAGYKGIGRTTFQQIKQGVRVGRGQLRPGDLVFPESGHVGIYVGNGMVLEAPHTGDVVKTIPLSQFGFMTARRLIRGGGGVTPPSGPVRQGAIGLPVPQPQAIHLSAPQFHFTPANVAAVSALPGGTMQPSPTGAPATTMPGLPAVSTGPSAAGSLEQIRRRLLA